MSKKICAIYTRKSSEEGLEQDFNSLHAQRESCEAYITSQKSEGWSASKVIYDDGGFSGGTLERPAIQQLLEDIQAGKVHIVVVYKIDRLTRSLMDFSKLVEVFDAHGVTFVSVTQSFNTTTSMGRLTLNVLLSFAQFEREVTGERIRDKISASKKKGMWMGGTPPLGYKLKDRKLLINSKEQELAKHIYERYLALGNVRDLKHELDAENIKSPKRVSDKGNPYGGYSFSRGALYSILKNPAYIGKIKHKKQIYDGLHEPIIDEAKWQQVQNMLKGNTITLKAKTRQRHVLQGLLYDIDGVPYSPTFTKKRDRQYRYYISQNLLQFKNHPKGLIARLPAHEIEQTVEQSVRMHIAATLKNDYADCIGCTYIAAHMHEISMADITTDIVEKVILQADTLTLHFKKTALNYIAKKLEVTLHSNIEPLQSATVPYNIKRIRDGAVVIETPDKKVSLMDKTPAELKPLVQGIIWRDRHLAGETIVAIAKSENYSKSYVSKLIMQSFDSLMQAA